MGLTAPPNSPVLSSHEQSSELDHPQSVESLEAVASLGTNEDPPEILLHHSNELHPYFSSEPWTLVHFFTEDFLPKGFNLDQTLSSSSITVELVPNIVEHKDQGSYELVATTSCLHLLSRSYPTFKVIKDYDPFKPAEADIRIHVLEEAKKRARVSPLNDAVEAIRNGWGDGPAECYQNAARKAGLESALESSILNWDIKQSNPQVHERLAKNLLFFSLNLLDHYDTAPARNLLARNQNDWLELFQGVHTDHSELFTTADTVIRARKRSEQQTILLFRRFLEFSGGEVDYQRYRLNPDYTTPQNASLCARFLGFPTSRCFGRFDPQKMQDALAKSKFFIETLGPVIPDVFIWSLQMMAIMPIGFPDINLLLCELDAQQVSQLCLDFENIYRQLPSLRKDYNNILLFPSLSHKYHGQTLKVLSNWVRSKENSDLCQKLVNGLRLPLSPEDFMLTLVALLCRERLFPYTMKNITQPVGSSYLTDLNTILNGQDISNRRTVFEQIVSSFVRVLDTYCGKDLIQLPMEILGQRTSLSTPLNGVLDEYCARKICGSTHDTAFREAAKSESDIITDTELVIILELAGALRKCEVCEKT
ncbi:hypothetical protein N7G274_004655 [Stereocaulon virgatum]|uniref:Uncharacterized protein n=1 Tax=Stereocaulon virgatum TaxID=373712 RepID=A0ABR4ABL5_9LECA